MNCGHIARSRSAHTCACRSYTPCIYSHESCHFIGKMRTKVKRISNFPHTSCPIISCMCQSIRLKDFSRSNETQCVCSLLARTPLMQTVRDRMIPRISYIFSLLSHYADRCGKRKAKEFERAAHQLRWEQTADHKIVTYIHGTSTAIYLSIPSATDHTPDFIIFAFRPYRPIFFFHFVSRWCCLFIIYSFCLQNIPNSFIS